MSFLEVDVGASYLLANEVIADRVNCGPSARGEFQTVVTADGCNKYLEVTWKTRVNVTRKVQ